MTTKFERLALKQAAVEVEIRELHAVGEGGGVFERKGSERERIEAESAVMRERERSSPMQRWIAGFASTTCTQSSSNTV